MFFIVSKILAFIGHPLLWIFVLLTFAVFVKSAKRKKLFLLSSFILFIFFTNPFILNKFAEAWTVETLQQEQMKEYDFGIVLSGMIAFDDKADRVLFNNNVNRITQAIELYRKGYIRKIFISGGSGSVMYDDKSEAAILKKYLVDIIQLPESDILVETKSNNTRENAFFTKETLDELNLSGSKLLLITSEFHMRRAKACFEKAGLDVDVYTSGRSKEREAFLPENIFIPQAETLFLWNNLLHEWVGVLVYKIAGYI